MDFLLKNLKNIIWAIIGISSVALVFKYRKKIQQFLLEVKQELGKVSWSNRQELIGSTGVVIMVTAIMAVFIGVVDLVLSKILTVLFKL